MHGKSQAEQHRLRENAQKEVPLELWGPYLSERQWGTVREDYSTNGDAWNYFPHDHARSRAYLWGEDGLAGISDYFQNLCFAIALWNHNDPILKERLFGLTNGEGNHGEDVKELYYYLDNMPTHYYMKYLYKYPHAAYPYDQLIEENKRRNREEPEFEILDTGVFNDGKYFDVFVEYAKQSDNDIYIKLEIHNRGEEAAELTVLPTLWMYNKWQYNGLKDKPSIEWVSDTCVKATHERLDETYYLYFEQPDDLLFTGNETNTEKILGKANVSPFVKDAFHNAIVHNRDTAELREVKKGTKCSPVYNLNIKADSSATIYLRLCTEEHAKQVFDAHTNALFDLRKREADEFYEGIVPSNIPAARREVLRQAFAGLLWSKQYYHNDIERWISEGDGITPLTEARKKARNHNWKYLKNQDVIIMPDKWEYPWYASWDLAFHCIPMALIDPAYAKHQLLLLLREWYMNPEGQLPAYEWNFSDVNPPVHAFAALQVYYKEKSMTGKGDVSFLRRIFQKLIINFTWWTNRKDMNGNNIFEGGFLGLDNIGLFNRSEQLREGVYLDQTDGTSWMGMYALNLMDIAIEIAQHDPAYQDTSTKFYEHFVLIAEALNELGLWNYEDNFFYDVLCINGEDSLPLKVRSIVGLTPLFAVSYLDDDVIDKLPEFKKRMTWYRNYRRTNNKFMPSEKRNDDECSLLSMLPKHRLQELLKRLLNEDEFLSDGGIRALSKYYKDHPYTLNVFGIDHMISYDPGDSTSGVYGGNSNWRGPVWMPMNYLVIHALEKYGAFYGDELLVEFPTGSGYTTDLDHVARLLTERIVSAYLPDKDGNRKIFGTYNWFYSRPENQNLLQFYEYFHGDDLRGLGASHQTGWTALITDMIINHHNGSTPAKSATKAAMKTGGTSE